MKSDIDFTPIKDVTIAVILMDFDYWEVCLLNRGAQTIDTILVTGKGYGTNNGHNQKTSMLRHAMPSLEPGAYAKIEPISRDVFHLTNEYWVSYYVGNQIFDKKFIFVPDTIIEKYLTFIPELNAQGVLPD